MLLVYYYLLFKFLSTIKHLTIIYLFLSILMNAMNIETQYSTLILKDHFEFWHIEHGELKDSMQGYKEIHTIFPLLFKVSYKAQAAKVFASLAPSLISSS